MSKEKPIQSFETMTIAQAKKELNPSTLSNSPQTFSNTLREETPTLTEKEQETIKNFISSSKKNIGGLYFAYLLAWAQYLKEDGKEITEDFLGECTSLKAIRIMSNDLTTNDLKFLLDQENGNQSNGIGKTRPTVRQP